MPDGFKPFWRNVEGLSEIQLYRRIKASCGTLDQFEAEVCLVDAIVRSDLRFLTDDCRVLDFGCGCGRNIPAVLEAADGWSVVGYDNEGMIRRAFDYLSATAKGGRIECLPCALVSDWRLVERMQFDVVVASLVFQHIERRELARIMTNLARVAPRMVVLSRTHLDQPDGGPVIDCLLPRWEQTSMILDPPGSCHPGHWLATFERKER